MSQCGDYEDIHFYVINMFYGKVIAVYFLPFKKKSPCIVSGKARQRSHIPQSIIFTRARKLFVTAILETIL